MSPDFAVEIGREALYVAVLLASPILLSALIVGELVGMFQAATQINEQTLSFLPRLLVMLLTLIWAGPWLVRELMEYTQNLVHNIPLLIG